VHGKKREGNFLVAKTSAVAEILRQVGALRPEGSLRPERLD
jgi:hypothetical protein